MRLSLNSQRSVCLCLPSAGIKGVCYHTLNSQKSVCLCLPDIGIKGVCYHTLKTQMSISTSVPWSHRGQYASASQALGLKVCTTTPNYSLSFLLTLRTLTFSLHIFLTHWKPFRGFLQLWIFLLLYISLFLTTGVFKERMKAVALMAESSPFLSFPALLQRYQL